MANMHHDEEIDNPDVHHEESDVNIRAIFGFALGLFVVAAVVHVAIYFLFVLFANREASGDAVRAYPLSIGQENRLPPEPRLQTNPKQDLRDLRAAEDVVLNGYRWVDRNAGVVGIPVSEAMKLTLQRGLPSRPAASAPAAPGAGTTAASTATGNR
jgi:hypothetical protein